MKELQELARDLLQREEVAVVVGYEESRLGVRPAFVTSPDDAGRLVFGPACLQSLVTFAHPRRGHVGRLGRRAVVVKGCDTLALAVMLRESQVKREDLVLIGVRCGGVLTEPRTKLALDQRTVAPRCAGCRLREPRLVDHLVGELPPEPPISPMAEEARRFRELPREERRALWMEAFERCTRCYACRQVCPLCGCQTCIVEKSQPQWIETSAHARGNMAWHLTRAMHLAGRCVGCGECARVCPEGLPLHILHGGVAEAAERHFGHHPSDDPESQPLLGSFRDDDTEDFIL